MAAAAFTVRIPLTGTINGSTVLPATALVTPNADGTVLTVTDSAGVNIVGNVGRINLSFFDEFFGFRTGLVTTMIVVDPVGTVAAAASAPVGIAQRWSPFRSWNPNAGADAFMPNTLPLLGGNDELIVSTNGVAGIKEIIFQFVPAAAADVMKMAAASLLFAPDTGNPLSIVTTGYCPFTSENAPLVAPAALALGVQTIYDTTAGAIAVTVAQGVAGQTFGVKNIFAGSANGLTITPAGGLIENIAGAAGASAVIASATASIIWEATDVGNWLIKSRT